jgi:small subunit ribosomal protein S16
VFQVLSLNRFMAVKIRLARRGRKKLAMFDIVVADARAPRDGRFIEKVGTYNPNVNPAGIRLDSERAFYWIMQGAQPTHTVRAILSYRGIMFKKHLQVGVAKGAITQEEADKRFENWLADKDAKIQGKADRLGAEAAAAAAEALDAEKKVSEARAEAIRARDAVEEPVAEEPAAAEPTAEEPAAQETAPEETPAEETPAEEPAAEEPKGEE